jgi:hypothetical protein
VTEKEALQKAADEARKTARAGREFAGLLDDYAKWLTQPNWRQRADEYHRSALNKLSVIKEGLAACSKLIEESKEAAAANSIPQEALKQAATPQPREEKDGRKKRVAEKPARRPIRIAKKAAGQ